MKYIKRSVRPKIVQAMLLGLLFLGAPAGAVTTEYTDLSLDELLKIDIDVATLTGMSRERVPVSLTTITKEDIALTPARHILDLIEVYVPGAFWEAHSETGHPGIRGVIADRNGKVLLLVNGRKMNQDAHAGAVSELENYDLGDIERIEIIRGPGSVTYGPGAIMGVVNIITKQAADNQGFRATSFGNYQYRQNGSSLSYGLDRENLQVYAYGSATRTLGQKDTRLYAVYDSVTGYVGDDIYASRLALHDTLANGTVRPVGTLESGNLLGDYWYTPQLKAMLDVTLYKNNRFMARYANSGNVQLLTLGNASQTHLAGESELINPSPISVRQYMLSFENTHEFHPKFTMVSTGTWNDQDYRRMIIRDTNDIGALSNYTHNFSEKHLTVGTLGKFTPMAEYKFALGAEYSRNIVGAPWFQSASMMRLGDAQNMFGDTSVNNPAIYRGTGTAPTGFIKKGSEIYVGDGWQTNTVSFVGEANLEFHPLFTLLLSGRADKDDNSNWGLSPRLAWIGEINDQWIAKLIGQRSVRMNFMEQSYLENKKGSASDPEVLQGVEGILGWTPREDVSVGLSAYFNNYDVLGFSRLDTTTKRVGTLDVAGVELEAKYSTHHLTVGMSHSFLKQLAFKLSETSTQSGISYEDFHPSLIVTNGKNKDTVVIDGYGDNLNNWPSNATKAFVNWKIIEPLTLHLDSRLFWVFQGGKDGLEVYGRNADALPAADSLITQRVHATIDSIRAHNMFDTDFRINASLAYAFSRRGTITLYCQNLFGLNENKRYPYDAGDIRVYSSRWQYFAEPRTFGANLAFHFE